MGQTIIHHIVYSVKGGCGKTAFSLALETSNLVQFLKRLACLRKDEAETEIVNYYLDLDFLGTSLLHCLGDEGFVTMQDLMFNNKRINLIDEINSEILGAHIVPAAVEEKDKSVFHVKRKHTPLLKYDEFKYELRAILKNIEIFESDKTLINLIYDLPPNSDGYTEAFFDEIFKKEKDSVILYLIYNSDTSLKCNLDWLSTLLSGNNYSNFTIVLVDNIAYLQNVKSVGTKDAIKNICFSGKYRGLNDLELYYFTVEKCDSIRALYNPMPNTPIKTTLASLSLIVNHNNLSSLKS